MRTCLWLALLSLPSVSGCATDSRSSTGDPAFVQAQSPEQAGRYLFLMGGCNDCHTPGWAESDGKLPEQKWAVGGTVGFRGPWGTSYAENLRLSAQEHTEEAWVDMFREGSGLPPMPWQNYRDASESDLVALQRFLLSLGPRGKPAPEPLPPGKEPATPYIDMTPRGGAPTTGP